MRLLNVSTDLRGSTLVVSDADTKPVGWFAYDPFGATREAGGTIEHLTRRYTGQQFDPECGFYDHRARRYDADLARFVCADPQHQTPAPYTYCANDPVDCIDPTGRVIAFVVRFKGGPGGALTGYFVFDEQGRFLLATWKQQVFEGVDAYPGYYQAWLTGAWMKEDSIGSRAFFMNPSLAQPDRGTGVFRSLVRHAPVKAYLGVPFGSGRMESVEALALWLDSIAIDYVDLPALLRIRVHQVAEHVGNPSNGPGTRGKLVARKLIIEPYLRLLASIFEEVGVPVTPPSRAQYLLTKFDQEGFDRDLEQIYARANQPLPERLATDLAFASSWSAQSTAYKQAAERISTRLEELRKYADPKCAPPPSSLHYREFIDHQQTKGSEPLSRDAE